jgi:hypothetical protein
MRDAKKSVWINTYVRINSAMARHSLRDTIFDAGLKVMFRLGYNGSTVLGFTRMRTARAIFRDQDRAIRDGLVNGP